MHTALVVNALIVLGSVLFLASASAWLGPRRRPRGAQGEPYETGMPPHGSPLGRIAVPYYRFAVLFVVFDVYLAFLLPWALLRRELTAGLLASVAVFMAILLLTLAYVWRKGGLRCD